MSVGLWQILVVLLVVLIVFGAGRLPRVMGDLGKGLRQFKEGMDGKKEESKQIPPLDEKDES